MDPAKEAAVDAALPKVPHTGMASVLFPKGTGSDTETDAKETMKHEVEDASIGDVPSTQDAAAHMQVKGQSSEAPTAPALSNDEAATKSDVNVDRENPALRAIGDHIDDSMTVNAVNGNPDDHSHLNPTPLTNGHLEEPVNAPNENGQFDDIWSPATKLKRRLEDTNDLIVCPGVYDGFSARIALSVGFDAMYMVVFTFCFNLRSVEQDIGADGHPDRCGNHCFQVGHGRPRHS